MFKFRILSDRSKCLYIVYIGLIIIDSMKFKYCTLSDAHTSLK